MKSYTEFLEETQSDLHESKGEDLARKLVSSARSAMKKMNDDEVEKFRQFIKEAFDL